MPFYHEKIIMTIMMIISFVNGNVYWSCSWEKHQYWKSGGSSNSKSNGDDNNIRLTFDKDLVSISSINNKRWYLFDSFAHVTIFDEMAGVHYYDDDGDDSLNQFNFRSTRYNGERKPFYSLALTESSSDDGEFHVELNEKQLNQIKYTGGDSLLFPNDDNHHHHRDRKKQNLKIWPPKLSVQTFINHEKIFHFHLRIYGYFIVIGQRTKYHHHHGGQKQQSDIVYEEPMNGESFIWISDQQQNHLYWIRKFESTVISSSSYDNFQLFHTRDKFPPNGGGQYLGSLCVQTNGSHQINRLITGECSGPLKTHRLLMALDFGFIHRGSLYLISNRKFFILKMDKSILTDRHQVHYQLLSWTSFFQCPLPPLYRHFSPLFFAIIIIEFLLFMMLFGCILLMIYKKFVRKNSHTRQKRKKFQYQSMLSPSTTVIMTKNQINNPWKMINKRLPSPVIVKITKQQQKQKQKPPQNR